MNRTYYGDTHYGCSLKDPPVANTFMMAKAMGKNRLAAARIRLRYLKQQVDFMLPSQHPVVLFWANNMLKEANQLMKHMYFEPTERKDSITAEDVEAARNYKVDRLIEFRNGKAQAWCHEDKNPTLNHMNKVNKAYCWACGKYFNSIDVLMKRDGMKFIEAVKSLRGG